MSLALFAVSFSVLYSADDCFITLLFLSNMFPDLDMVFPSFFCPDSNALTVLSALAKASSASITADSNSSMPITDFFSLASSFSAFRSTSTTNDSVVIHHPHFLCAEMIIKRISQAHLFAHYPLGVIFRSSPYSKLQRVLSSNDLRII